MSPLVYTRLNGQTATLSPSQLQVLSRALSGQLITPVDPPYDAARTVWNATVERRPALIARCLNADDVRQTVLFARSHRMLTSIRGGGHHIAGNAMVEGGLVIDMSAMRNVQVDAANRTARVDPGALLSDVDQATQAVGLATPLGINSTTGVAGLCLGGGFGWLTRRYGLTIDNLLSADIVTADGKLRNVSRRHEPDLFWALRGGGGNFGVVTAFEFKLHPVGPQVYAGLVVYPLDQGRQVLRAWRELCAMAPRTLSIWPVLRKAPPLPFLPESIHGREVVIFALLYSGPVENGERITSAVLDFGTPVGSMLGPQSYAEFQTAFDPLLEAGARNYWKSNNFEGISDELIDLLVTAAATGPDPECEIFIAQLGGVAGKIGVTETPYAGRDANFVMNIHGRWRSADRDARVKTWVRGLFTATAPFATGGGYVNFLTEEEGERVAAAYGPNYPRLRQIKARYDPNNLFRVNQNIRPAKLPATA